MAAVPPDLPAAAATLLAWCSSAASLRNMSMELAVANAAAERQWGGLPAKGEV
jgi:hypothetical protein